MFQGLIINFLVGAITCYLTGFWTYLLNSKSKVNRAWLVLSVCAGTWSLFHFLMAVTSHSPTATFYAYITYLSAILIPSLFLRFILLLTNQLDFFKLYLTISWVFVIIFNFLLASKNFIIGVTPKLYFKNYDNLGFIGFIFFIYYVITASFAWFLLIKSIIQTESNLKKVQQTYMAIAALFGFFGGGCSFLLAFNIYKFYLLILCFYLFPLYPIIVSYAVIKYRFLDIKVIVTRAFIFLLVYTCLLGVPFFFGYKMLGTGLWITPMLLLGFLAILGPFIYFYIQKRAEDRLLKEQKTYQATLRQASAGMGRIKDLNKLLNLIVFILTRTVRLEHSLVYIIDEQKKGYKLGAVKRRASSIEFKESISIESPLVTYLLENHNPIVYEEIKQKSQDYQDTRLSLVEKVINELNIELVVPIYIDNRLVAFVGMGKKENGKLFSEDDLAVFTILGNQAALAIENAKFYEDMKITQQQLFQAEKMATIGTMADGLSHQINNRFHALGFIAGDALDTIKINKDQEMSDKLKAVMAELEKAFNRVQDNVKQGGEVVQGLLKYSRKGQDGFAAVDVDAVITNAYEMAQFKIKSSQMSLHRLYQKENLPQVKGNFTQLQEVFFNMIDNAYDAMMQRKNDFKEEGFQPTLKINAYKNDGHLEMVFEDNGIGVKEEDIQKLFTPFFTTKLSSKKGTGLGLYVIRKIIEENHGGKVEFSSKYKQGTKMKLLLPLFN